MTIQAPRNPPPMPQTLHLPLPGNAPFSEAQKEWLGGFFAALMEGTATTASAAPSLANELADNSDAPWHDPAMLLADRLKLAEGRPLAPKLMAAMAQQDCGQCGYTCAAYANALSDGKEVRQNLCAPGGKDTFRAVKSLMQDNPAASAVTTVTPTGPAGNERAVSPRAKLAARYRLNAKDSEKDTWHIEISLEGTGLAYSAGDSLGIVPRNAPALVDAIIGQLSLRPDRMIGGKTLRDALIEDYDLGPAPDALFELIGHVTGGERRIKARQLANGEDPDKDAAMLDVLGALHKFNGLRFDSEAFVETLQPLQPRLYSISSSPRHKPGTVSLTVDAVRYQHNKRLRLGVASTYLSERLAIGSDLPVFVQKAHGFALPADTMKPVIMVGPGTGIAPFRAFLQEREATGSKGKNWLFFGHQRPETDFFYKDELQAMQERGVLSRLSLAWSRQGDEKFYVQDRMRQSGSEIWSWLEDGAHFYICGDAKRMARDVERALVDIVAEHGTLNSEAALGYVNGLKANGRYQADVY